MEKINLSVNLVNAILGYLGKRPYEETFQLIAAIQEEAKPKEDNGNDGTAS
jgi:hypothetical protein